MWFFSSIISGKCRRGVRTLKHCLLCKSVVAFIPSLLFVSTSPWPWQETHHCEGSVQKKKKKNKGRKCTKVGEIVWLKWNECAVCEVCASLFLLERQRLRTTRAPLIQGGAGFFFFPGAEQNERTPQRSSQQSGFNTDFLHLTATLITLSGGTCAGSTNASTLLPSCSLFYWAQVHTTFPLSVLYSLSE